MSISRETTIKKYEVELKKMADSAMSEISKMKMPVIQFSGPISTGGFGSVSENLECLSSCIEECKVVGISVFDQIAYEKNLDKILRDHTGYDYPLLDFFYKPILASNKIQGIVFLPLWETSTGSKWEYDYAVSLGIPTYFMENMLIENVKKFYEGLKQKLLTIPPVIQ